MCKKLPIGIQSFEKIIEMDFLYVDKTPFIHRLVSEGQLYFLSRPRRFGKSVLLSTLAALWRGRRDLFQGLYIADHHSFEKRPVIRLDMLGLESNNPQRLGEGLMRRLDEQAGTHGVTLSAPDCADRFRELILKVAQNGPVVVLVDEYDKPILDHIEDPERAGANRAFLATFYGVLKSVEQHLGFLFITGVSKFAKVSLFSDLNNLEDITLSPAYAGIAGYTEPELARYLAPYFQEPIDGLQGDELRRRIKTWYNGYSWDGETRVYNPVSVLNLLRQRQFAHFWFATGTAKFLVKMLRGGSLSIPQLEGVSITGLSLDAFEPDHIDPIALLFQTGYLTIASVRTKPGGKLYLMNYPNQEVKDAFLTHLLADLIEERPGVLGARAWALGDSLRAGDIERFCVGLQAVFSAVPYNLFIDHREAYYHTVIYLVLSLIGVDLACEIQTNEGRIDAVLETETSYFLVEFKLGDAQEAIDQIQDRDYTAAYKGLGKKVYMLGIGIDVTARNLKNWLLLEV